MKVKIVKVYEGCENTAIIEKHTGRPAFAGDKVKAPLFRVIFSAMHDNGFIYSVSCFDSLKGATDYMKDFPFFVEVKKGGAPE